MIKQFTALLAVLSCLHCPPSGAADLCSQCLLGVPHFNQPKIFADPSTLPLTITAEQSGVHYNDCAWFRGTVAAWQGNWHLTAEALQLNNLLQRTLKASGNVRYFNPLIQIVGGSAEYAVKSQNLAIYGASYQFMDRQGRGAATLLQQQAGRQWVIKQGTFTTCLPGDNSWQIKGSSIVHDSDKQLAEIWNARFVIAGLPILYCPYWQLPTGPQRRSGFLSPTIELPTGFSRQLFKEQLALSLPYYWNIAPNLDATITPHYMSHRGLQWQLAWRYLIAPGSGTFAYDYLRHDRQQPHDQPRYLFHWRHQGLLNHHWHFDINHTNVSDHHYFSDLKSKYGTHTDSYATQAYSMEYLDRQYSIRLLTRNFQLFQEKTTATYRLQPRLEMQFFGSGWFNRTTDFQLYTQVAQLNSSCPTLPSALRLHLAPSLTTRVASRWGNSQLQAQLSATHYQQMLAPGFRDLHFKERINRVVPQFKVDHSLLFERLHAGLTTTHQTLEPRIQYLYRPYREQRGIATYDTALLQKGYHSLFSDRQYSGLDRIDSANQLSMGITTRWFNQDLRECVNVAIGQLYPLSKPRTGIDLDDNRLSNGANHWIIQGQWLLDDHWSLQSGTQYCHRFKPLSLADALVEYRLDEHRMAQLNYRFVSLAHLQENYLNNQPPFNKGLSQIGLTTSWLLNHRWAVVARYHYDVNHRQQIKRQIGFQYNTCCWSVSLKYDQTLVAYKNHRPRYDNKLGLNFKLQGLRQNERDLGFSRLLDDKILPYQRPLFLPQ